MRAARRLPELAAFVGGIALALGLVALAPTSLSIGDRMSGGANGGMPDDRPA